MDGVWRNRLKGSAMPLTKLQSHVLRVLAAERSLDCYIAGGIAINRAGPRFSSDIDIFQPDLASLGRYRHHAGTTGGVWPSSPESSRAMLERYEKEQNGNSGERKP